MNDIEPTKEDIQKWCKALRSGKYKQGRGRLQTGDGYCCLGVACKVFIPEEDQNLREGFLEGYLPKCNQPAPEWLNRINNSFGAKTLADCPFSKCWDDEDEFGYRYKTLIEHLNDKHRLTFDEIADCLEAAYIHEVLS